MMDLTKVAAFLAAQLILIGKDRCPSFIFLVYQTFDGIPGDKFNVTS